MFFEGGGGGPGAVGGGGTTASAKSLQRIKLKKNLIFVFLAREGGGVGLGAKVSDFFYKESKSKIKKWGRWRSGGGGGGGGGVGWSKGIF